MSKRPKKEDYSVDIKNFSAADARKIMNGGGEIDMSELTTIVKKINSYVSNSPTYNKNCIGYYDLISGPVRKHLEKQGFKIENQNSLAIQKDNLHYLIYW